MKSESNSLFIYGVLGVLILLSWLIYIPAVVFGVIFSMYLFFTLRSDEYGLLSTLIDPRYWLVVSPSGLVGILYLIFGPIQRIRNTTSSTYLSEPTLFIEAEAYGITQKIVRYVSYTYFDFWWHRSGFDLEASILPLYKGLNQFLGPFFEVYLAGFALVTSIASIVIIYGIYLSVKNIDRFKLFLLSTILIFAVIWNLKNIGWRGTFQTRHVFPVFPVLCIMFGFGAFNCTKFIASKIGEDPNLPINTDSLVSTLLIMLFVVLLINGGVHGVIRGEKYEIGREDPANQLEHVVEKDDSVGIVQGRLYRSTILYTEAAVRPVMLVESDLQREEFMKFSPYADTRVTNFSNPDLNDIDYLYLKSGCGNISGKRQQVLDYAVQSGGEIVYETHKERNGFRCSSINVYIISV
jgi:hypothetical protein